MTDSNFISEINKRRTFAIISHPYLSVNTNYICAVFLVHPYAKNSFLTLLQKLIMTQQHHELSGLIACKCQIAFQSDGFLL